MSDTNTKTIGKTEQNDLLFRILIAVSCICVLIQIYSITHKVTVLTSLSNMILSISWVLIGAYKILSGFFGRASGTLVRVTGVVLFAVIGFGLGVLINTSVIGLIGQLLGFLVLPIMLYTLSTTAVSDKTRKLVLLTNIIASLQYILLYHSNLRNVFTNEYGTTTIPSVTLGFPNPNQTASMLFICLILLFISLFSFRNFFVRAVLLADAAYISFILFKTDSRTAILLLAALVVLSLISFKKSLARWFIKLCLLAPIIYLIMAIVFSSVFADFEILGNSLFTGREDIYARYFENLDLISFFFGDLSEFPFENLHNGYLSIAAASGIVVFLLYYFFLRRILLEANHLASVSKTASIAYSGLLCIVIYSSTEAGFLIGGSTFAALVAMVFIMIPSQRIDQN